MKHNEVKKLQKHFSIAIIPGDGIGPEVVNEGLKVLKVLEEVHSGVRFFYDFYDWNCEYYLKHGRMMPVNGLNLLEDYDFIWSSWSSYCSRSCFGMGTYSSNSQTFSAIC
jgi:isocitrate/isopropylmalate dehydrogenase